VAGIDHRSIRARPVRAGCPWPDARGHATLGPTDHDAVWSPKPVPATQPRLRPLLLTGATGFLGMIVLARLLGAGREVVCLVRAADDEEAGVRLRAVLETVGVTPDGRASAVAGDVTAERLGLGDRHDELAARVGTVIHSAASVTFDLPLAEARAINVAGTGRMLAFASAVPDLERFAHVSTAYVAGERRGIIFEDDGRRGRFRNSYEQSKHEAEELVRSSGLPWTITRPSIVVGERDTGWTSSFNVLYAPLRAFAAGAYPLVPARRRAPLDVVSVDYVADAVIALALHPQAAAGTFHLTAGARASTVGEIVELATGELECRPPRFVPPRAYRRLHPLVLRRAPSTTRRLLSHSEVYFPYFAMRQHFDDARARALLEPMGIEPTPLRDYFHRLMAFARAARWGRIPLGRGEAAALLSGVSAPA
jgi:thioester reductase-like protein